MLPNAIQERFHRVTPTKGYAATPHKPAIGDENLQGFTNTGKPSVSESHGKTSQTLHKLGGSEDTAKDIFFL
jgi:hypothetical protein